MHMLYYKALLNQLEKSVVQLKSYLIQLKSSLIN